LSAPSGFDDCRFCGRRRTRAAFGIALVSHFVRRR
jgi:hypothetical protein